MKATSLITSSAVLVLDSDRMTVAPHINAVVSIASVDGELLEHVDKA